ncbi:MAG: hypothetical protein OK438_06165 [Thaumarchaeota archaeon]|nr:hypothetical protein [Nitrososphaerota archaeon]
MSNAAKGFVLVSVLGVIGSFYHAWSEGAFTTNYNTVSFTPYASFFGVPYWAFGVVWFPLVLVIALWRTGMGRSRIGMEFLLILTVGNVFTGYLWYLDLEVVRAFTLVYVALYAANYTLTGLVVLENRKRDVMHGYAYGTGTGAVVGLLFGPYGVAACAIGGGIFGALRNFAIPMRSAESSRQSPVA